MSNKTMQKWLDEAMDYTRTALEKSWDRATVKKEILHTNAPTIDPVDFCKKVQKNKITLREYVIDSKEFEQWLKTADYDHQHPEYAYTYKDPKLRRKKALEHYLSLSLGLPERRETGVDIGGATSPFSHLAKRMAGFRHFYHADLPRKDYGIHAGMHGEYIGCNAREIPLPNNSVDFIVSHNAIEHFEGDAYAQCMREMMRMLRLGGKLVVLPLFVADKTFAFTSLHAWVRYQYTPDFSAVDRIVTREDISQPYSLHIDIDTLLSWCVRPLQNKMDVEVIFFKNWDKVEHAFPFAFVATKKTL